VSVTLCAGARTPRVHASIGHFETRRRAQSAGLVKLPRMRVYVRCMKLCENLSGYTEYAQLRAFSVQLAFHSRAAASPVLADYTPAVRPSAGRDRDRRDRGSRNSSGLHARASGRRRGRTVTPS